MSELLMTHATITSGESADFTVRIEALPDGNAMVSVWPGLRTPIVVMPGGPTTVRLQMPYTPDRQPLRIEVTREDNKP